MTSIEKNLVLAVLALKNFQAIALFLGGQERLFGVRKSKSTRKTTLKKPYMPSVCIFLMASYRHFF